MKVIHGSLQSFLHEVKGKKVEAVRVAAFMSSDATGGNGLPRYTAWVVATAMLDWDLWAEWRLLVGRGAAEATDKGAVVPTRVAQLMTERLQDVRERVIKAGLETRDGMLTHDADGLDGAID